MLHRLYAPHYIPVSSNFQQEIFQNSNIFTHSLALAERKGSFAAQLHTRRAGARNSKNPAAQRKTSDCRLSFIDLCQVRVGLIGSKFDGVSVLMGRSPHRQIRIDRLWVLPLLLQEWIQNLKQSARSSDRGR